MRTDTQSTTNKLASSDLNVIADHLLTYFEDDPGIVGVPESELSGCTDRFKTLASALTDNGFGNLCRIDYLMEYCQGLDYDRGHLDEFIVHLQACRTS